MTVAQWNPGFSVGVEQLDADHQRLISTMNEVFDSVFQGASSESIRKALATLNDYVEDHFRREEDWMLRTKYPHLARHLKEHDALRENIRRLTELHNNSKGDLTLDLLIVLRDWLFGHIARSDLEAASAAIPKSSTSSDRRKRGERRKVDLGAPSNMNERRDPGQRRAINVAEVEISKEEWEAHFSKKPSCAKDKGENPALASEPVDDIRSR